MAASTIDELKATLVRALERGDATLAAALYEPGARLLPPGAPVITGEDAVRDFWQRRIDGGSDGGVLETVHRAEYGDVAIEEGRYGRRSGETLLDSGKYLVVFRRRPDGAWRFATDMWNSDAG
ncbi:nuclear transport factor 2 family protein [Blastococcus sp. CT_GayMR16]|nr:nuclear transport factor 2 family protein [Blastococcus sp. CT_GayMR16]